jgi:Cu/Ag efflux pump CusA
MWIVRLALNKPYTFVVAAILIVVLGTTSIATTPTDVFPRACSHYWRCTAQDL